MLAHEIGMHPLILRGAQEKYEIPIRCVRRAGNHIFWDVWQHAINLPPFEMVEENDDTPHNARQNRSSSMWLCCQSSLPIRCLAVTQRKANGITQAPTGLQAR